MAKRIGIIGRIGNAAEQLILSRVKSSSLYNEYYNRSEKGADWKRQATVYKRKEIQDWTNAVIAATDPDNPRRGELMRFYQSLRLDLHLSSVIDTRVLRVQRSSYKIVNDNGDENEELKDLLERPWFDDIVRLVLNKTFNGTTLIEMFDTDTTTMELLRVNEIPQSNFIPQKGVIIKEEYDDDGVSYIEGRYKDFYVQVGNNWELGMLNELAMIVLAKKLGLGSWMSYIEKFGVPPVFAITERMDTTRRDELYEMLSMFRMNHFAVLQGSEKIEVPNNYNVDAYNSFKTLINDVCNTEISKRVLGGTAMVDEKSFVGSAQVQERVAQDRYEADKLLFKYYFNTQIRQRLAKLSSIYADFATHTLIWDNQETLDINGYIDAVQKLSTAFEFDIEEVKNRTGLPIIGTKASVPNPTEPTTQKKNPDASVITYQLPEAQTEILGLFAATWDAAIERLANDIYDGKVKPTDLDKDLVLKNYAAFNKEAKKAWGKGYYDESITRDFRENFLKFAGAKAHDLMKQLDALNTGKTTKEDFVSNAKAIVNKHNGQWLNVETKFCATSVSNTRDYKTYLDDVDIYPNLKYRNFKDESSRESHAANDGIIKPVAEWTALPPYAEGCRCWLEQTTEAPTNGKLTGIKFSNNPYKSGDVFNQEQSYFKKIEDKYRGTIIDNTELLKQYMPYNTEIKVGEQSVFVNDFYDLADGADNIKAAKLLAKELEQDVYVLSHIENSGKLHVKNPELGIGRESYKADLKTFTPDVSTGTRNFITNSIKSANKQGCQAVVFDLSKAHEKDSLLLAANKLRGEMKGTAKANIKKIFIIKDNKVLTATRKQLAQNNYLDYFKID